MARVNILESFNVGIPPDQPQEKIEGIEIRNVKLMVMDGDSIDDILFSARAIIGGLNPVSFIWIKGHGNNQFLGHQVYQIPDFTMGYAVKDFNNDGYRGLLLEEYSSFEQDQFTLIEAQKQTWIDKGVVFRPDSFADNLFVSEVVKSSINNNSFFAAISGYRIDFTSQKRYSEQRWLEVYRVIPDGKREIEYSVYFGAEERPITDVYIVDNGEQPLSIIVFYAVNFADRSEPRLAKKVILD